jgi:sulfur-oxidizing protein SoxY
VTCADGDPGALPALGAALSRRRFLGLATTTAAALWIPRAWASASSTALDGRNPEALSPLQRQHLPTLRLPDVTSNGAKVPIVIEMDHPMTPDHHITKVQVVNLRDPVPSKGTFHLTPANGRVYLSFQARMHHGASNVSVTVECNRHGSWSTTRTIVIPDDAGG